MSHEQALRLARKRGRGWSIRPIEKHTRGGVTVTLWTVVWLVGF